MNKFMMMVVLLAGYLWTDAANAQEWVQYQEKDEMTGASGPVYPILHADFGAFFPQIEFLCDETDAVFILTTLNDTLPHMVWNGNYGVYQTPVRINWGNDQVQSYVMVQRDYQNRFVLGIMKMDMSKINPSKFKLELTSDSGQKYYISSNGYMSEYLLGCKNKQAEIVAAAESHEEQVEAFKRGVTEVIASHWVSNDPRNTRVLVYYSEHPGIHYDQYENGLCEIRSYFDEDKGYRVIFHNPTTSCFNKSIEAAIDKTIAESADKLPEYPDYAYYYWYVGTKIITP